MSAPHVHHLPRLASPRRIAHAPNALRSLLSQARPWQRYAAVTTLAALSGLCVGLAMPRGPVTSAQALTLLIVGFSSASPRDVILRSRWAMLLAPAAQIRRLRACAARRVRPDGRRDQHRRAVRAARRSSSAAASTGSSASCR